MLKFIFFSLFSHLAIGALLPMLVISVQEIGTLYFRFMSVLLAILLGIALITHPFAAPATWASEGVRHLPVYVPLSLLGLSIAMLIAGSILLKRIGKSYLYATLFVGIVALVLIEFFHPVSATIERPAVWVRVLGFLGSSLLLGSVLTAMITGHWYLVNRRLAIQPLQRATMVLLAATGLRVCFVVAMMAFLALPAEGATSGAARSMLSLSSGQGLLFWTRVGIGLVLPAVFGTMVYQTVRLRSTQSATGILYATVIFVFIGEAFSKFLEFFTGIPV